MPLLTVIQPDNEIVFVKLSTEVKRKRHTWLTNLVERKGKYKRNISLTKEIKKNTVI